mmetsp:Transcript_43988/g.138259  ORF Transcript_43988/g.138259 Transcript_43988/m.138259 type:complete len:326 (+) Transcript_43988:363-1340(+)
MRAPLLQTSFQCLTPARLRSPPPKTALLCAASSCSVLLCTTCMLSKSGMNCAAAAASMKQRLCGPPLRNDGEVLGTKTRALGSTAMPSASRAAWSMPRNSVIGARGVLDRSVACLCHGRVAERVVDALPRREVVDAEPVTLVEGEARVLGVLGEVKVAQLPVVDLHVPARLDDGARRRMQVERHVLAVAQPHLLRGHLHDAVLQVPQEDARVAGPDEHVHVLAHVNIHGRGVVEEVHVAALAVLDDELLPLNAPRGAHDGLALEVPHDVVLGVEVRVLPERELLLRLRRSLCRSASGGASGGASSVAAADAAHGLRRRSCLLCWA